MINIFIGIGIGLLVAVLVVALWFVWCIRVGLPRMFKG